MRVEEFKCLSWSVSDMFSNKSNEECFSFHGKDFKLTLEFKAFNDALQDCFTLCIRLNNCGIIGLSPFSVKTFIEDDFQKMHFLQTSKIVSNNSDLRNGKIIWNVKRSDIMAIQKYLPIFETTFVVLCGDDCNWIRNMEKQYKNRTERNIAHSMCQTDFELKSSFCMESLSFDLRNILKDEVETDLILKCGDQTFPAHKVILSARSEVFATMFRSNMSEKRDGIVEISDIDPAVLKEFLEYVYTGGLTDITEDTAPFLFSVAHKYAVHALQRKCGDFMERNLSESNACSFLILADTHGDNDFKNRIINFVRFNEILLSGEDWNKLCHDYPKLGIDVYRTLYRNISPLET